MAPDGYSLLSDTVLHDCYRLDNIVPESTAAMYSLYSGTPGISVNAEFFGAAGNQASLLGPNTPPIRWDVTYSINATNPTYPSYSLQYNHTCYPAFEAYIGSQFVYGYKPWSNNAIFVSGCLLGAIPHVTGTAIGAVQ